MHVLYSCADPGIAFWGTKGASIHVRSFTGALAAAGHEVTVVMSRIGRHALTLPDRVRLVEVPSEQESFFQSDVRLGSDDVALRSEARQFLQNRSMQDIVNDIVAHKSVDLICERYSLFGIAGRESSQWHKIPFVLEVNAPLVLEQREHRRLILEPLAREIERYLFATSDRVVAVSDTLTEYIRSIVPSAAAITIPNGVDIQAFAAASSGEEWRQRWGISDYNTRLIGFVGSLKPWHGLDLLMDAFSHVNASGTPSKLVLIGDGPLREPIEKDAAARGLSGRLVLAGALSHSDVPSATAALDILVAPYPEMKQFYFSPLKVYEYMAAGKPIVASGIGQISEILDHERTGLLVPPGNVRELSAAIERLLGDEALASRLGMNAQGVALREHGWSHRVTRWIELFDSARSLAISQEVIG